NPACRILSAESKGPKIDIESFGTQSPVRQERPFDAAAQGPAPTHAAVGRVVKVEWASGTNRIARRPFDTPVCEATCRVQQQSVESGADAAAQRTKPVHLRVVTVIRTRMIEPVDIGAGNIRFDAVYDATGLPIVADLHAA